jgi:hypothetical protein
MTGRTLRGWKDAWLVGWSFLWRQALALLLFSGVMGMLLGLLTSAKLIGPAFLFNMMGFITIGLLVLSCVVSFKLILDKFEVRAPGGSVEQDRRHGR